MERFLVLAGALLMMLAVGAGAFGAHALSGYFQRYPNYESIYATAVRYHMIHGLALFVVAFAMTRYDATGLLTAAGWLIIAGLLLFSGSLYLMVATRLSWLGAITPLGGVAFIGGWAALFVAAWRAG
jgi:uncharacterized membrane protein YgdD (TMEM256/DUF423 family)